jgi:hypothetical protein
VRGPLLEARRVPLDEVVVEDVLTGVVARHEE